MEECGHQNGSVSKGACSQVWQHEFSVLSSHNGSNYVTTVSCLLTSTHTARWTHTCIHTNTINYQPTWGMLAPQCPCSPLSETSSSTWQASLLRPGLHQVQSSSKKFILLGLVLLRALGKQVSSVKQCCLQANLWSKHRIPSPTYKVAQTLKYLAKPLYFRSISRFKFSD